MSDHVEVGEMNVQYVAETAEARRELKELREKVQSLEHVNAVFEDFAFDEFDQNLLQFDDE